MANIPPFYSNRKFYGDDYFPYGIERSGEFTREQAELLIQHGWAYMALAMGDRAPTSPEEEAFVAVCREQQAPETAHEKLWMLFRSKTSAQKAMVSSPLLGERPLTAVTSENHLDDDFESSTL